ncbi:uncharacterized protein LOC107980635 [Nasonia vitripennis]|uniref:Uncharacterized protein n=1 Tax=Nasonia vitripennis TaxID=7425 RepID=A0A7M7IP81_NASVI|nr:uncharacterized protein LOC107980635 [Nasonia vitripennis]
MNGARFGLCCVIVWLLNLGLEASSCSRNDAGYDEESKRNGSKQISDEDFKRSNGRAGWFEPITGLKVNYDNSELIVRYSPYGEATEGRALKRAKRQTILQRIGTFMAMIPIGMQLLQIPMAVASLKASLLKSLLVAKVALFMLFLRVLFMTKTRQKIVIVKSPSPSEFHEHYYHSFEDPEDNKPGWLGKGPAWMN